MGFMSIPSLVVTVESIDYYAVPDDDPLVILLDDDEGTEVAIGSDRVAFGSETIMYPSPVTSQTIISQSGHSVTLRPRPSQTPALGSNPQETQAAGQQILQSYAQWGSQLDQQFTSFFQSMWRLTLFLNVPAGQPPPTFLGPLESLLGSVSDEAIELDNLLSTDPFREFQDFASWSTNSFRISNPGKPFVDWLTDILGTVAGPKIRNIARTFPGAISKIQGIARMLSRRSWRSTAKLTTHLLKYQTQYMGRGTGVGIAVAVGITAAVLTKTSGPVVEEPPKDGSKRSWYMKCNEGTYPIIYQTTIAWIDGAVGHQVGSDPKFSNTGQGYFTTLDEEIGKMKMKQIELYPYITFIDLHADEEQTDLLRQYAPIIWPSMDISEPVFDSENYTNNTEQPKQGKLGDDGLNLEALPAPFDESFWHRRLMSMKSSDQLSLDKQKLYFRDPSQGQGITVFVMDSGFDTDHLKFEYRTQDKQDSEYTYVPEERLMQPDGSDPLLWPTNNIQDNFLINGRPLLGESQLLP
ncbi:hypothetical protein F4810DRAFT_182818 [Camillea tinctor]|nr:hypothetical protein F4810DRAFT_182818 [Camillea tinctor]